MVDVNEVVLVDSQDNVLGYMEKMEAHRRALLHRAISVFIFNSKGEWLLQKRADEKYHSPGLWTNSSCTHPYKNESYIDAANRRLDFEMGLHADLKDVYDFIYKEKLDNNLSEHELDHVFVGVTDLVPSPNKSEVSNFKYISTEFLMKDIKQNPDHYTVWFKMIVQKVKEIVYADEELQRIFKD